MRKIVRACVGTAVLAALVGTCGGCGRQSFEAPAPINQTVAFTPQPGQAESAHMILNNEGWDWVVQLNGAGFRENGAYSINLINAAGRLVGGVGLAPYALPVAPGGTVNMYDSFNRSGLGAASYRLAVYFHPNGDPGDFTGAVQVLQGALPTH